MRSERIAKGDKPWISIIRKIDETFEYMYAGFDNAFAEAQKDVKPREFIKRAFFRRVWNELTRRSEFSNLAELDAFYNNVHLNLKSYLSEFVMQDLIKSMCEQHNIVPGPNEISVISQRKLDMLEKIIVLYHSLSRNRFILTKLSDQLSVDRDKIISQVNEDKEKLFNRLTEDKTQLELHAAEEKEKINPTLTADRKKIDDWAATELERLGKQFEEDRLRLDARLREEQYYITPAKCEDMVAFLHGQSQVNNELVRKIDTDKYQTRTLNALRTLNTRLTTALQAKGYGEIVAEVTPSTDKNQHPELYEIYSRIEELPKVTELVDIVNGKAYDSKDMRAHKLSQHIHTIQSLRYVLQQIRSDVLAASAANVVQLTNEYEFLHEINKVDYSNVLSVYFRDLNELLKSQQKQASGDANIPVLIAVAREALDECNKQSQMEQYTKLVNNGWGVAGSSLRDRILDILRSTQSQADQYLMSKDEFTDEVRNKVDQLTSSYKSVMDFIEEWKRVNEQTNTIMEQCDNLLAVIEATLVSASQSLGQYVLSFGKRHWIEIGVISTICLASAITVPLVVASATALAATVPAAAVGGPAIGAGIGMAREKKKPPVAPPVVFFSAGVKNSAGVNTEFINKRLFDPPAPPPSVEAEIVSKKKFTLPVLEGGAKRIEKRSATVKHEELRLSLDESQLSDIHVSPVSVAMNPVNVGPKDTRPAEVDVPVKNTKAPSAVEVTRPVEFVKQKEVEEASAPPSTFMDKLSNVPGVSTLVGLPSQMVSMTTNIPSQVASIPSRVAAIPGLFAGRQEQGGAGLSPPPEKVETTAVRPKKG